MVYGPSRFRGSGFRASPQAPRLIETLGFGLGFKVAFMGPYLNIPLGFRVSEP